jgi:transposase
VDLDTTYVNVRDDTLGQVVSRAVVVATGITANGNREVLGNELTQDLLREFRAVDVSLTYIEKRMAAALDDHGSGLCEVDGVGAVTAVRLIGRTGPASRFETADAFATYAGVAPIEVAFGERTRHRLSRRGDRQLNSAIHLIAVTQV